MCYSISGVAQSIGRFVHTLDNPTTPFRFPVAGVVTAGGMGLGGAMITFSRVLGSGALPSPVKTNDSGVWFQTGFEPGTTYTATVTLGTYAFNPPSRDFTTTLELDFAATFIECHALAPLAITPGQTERGTLTTGDCTSP